MAFGVIVFVFLGAIILRTLYRTYRSLVNGEPYYEARDWFDQDREYNEAELVRIFDPLSIEVLDREEKYFEGDISDVTANER